MGRIHEVETIAICKFPFMGGVSLLRLGHRFFLNFIQPLPTEVGHNVKGFNNPIKLPSLPQCSQIFFFMLYLY